MLELKKCFKLFFICHLVLLQVSLVVPEIQSRIVGGSATTISDVPHLVQLFFNGRFFCGGTLLTRRYVVTAAHCVKDKSIEEMYVSAGATMLTDAGVRSRVSKIMVPKGFIYSTYNVDVAVLKLHTPVQGRGIQTTSLCKTKWQPGATVKVSGWGLTGENNTVVATQVHTVNVKVIAKSKCAELFRTYTNLTKSMFCAAILGRKDSCFGDSGGAAFINGQFCGVVSFGLGCAREAFPGVYTSVFAVRKFIADAIRE